jgi:hypothetical protein
MFVDHYVIRSSSQGHYSCPLALGQLKSHTLRKRKYRGDALFLIYFYLRSELCRSLLETVDLRVPAQYIKELSVFNVLPSS